MRWIVLRMLVALVAGWPLGSTAVAQIKAFPQAEGFGAAAKGGRGGDVYHVTNLNDTGVGSLRYGIDNAPTSGRTIVFDVGGWITIGSKLGINSDKRNITIAGQTAPGGGIGIRGNQFSVGGDHIVIRHMRFKPGKAAGRVDSAGANTDAQYVIYDHVSAGFSYDENFSVAGSDVTLQYSTVNYGLEDHSAGSLIEQAHRLSFHHNLYAHNNTRNPKARVNETLDWIDNVVYDYNNGFIAGDSDTTDYFWTANVDGNYYITGPGDTGRPMIRDGRSWNYGLYFGTNAYDNDGDAVHDGANYTGNGVDGSGLAGVVAGTYTWANAPYPTPEIWKDATPQTAYERVLSQFGATPWQRDEVDQLLHDNVVNRTGAIIERESDLAGITNGGFGTLAAGTASLDSDGDGMPNAWETKHGTNPAVANNNGDFDFDGYTDLEEYLNDLAAFPAVGPLEFSGIGRYADWKRWTNRWEPSKVDDVRVNSAAAFVDAVGQKAGTLAVGQNGRLYVTSGWLEVTDDLVVGGDGAGRVEHYGGEVRVLAGGVTVADGEYQLRGGVLRTPELAKAANGEFVFTGGVLQADLVGFDLVSNGGVLAPGTGTAGGIGATSVLGDLTLSGGGLQIQLASALSADAITVDGIATLGGSLSIAPIGGFVPTAGQSWQIVTATSFAGTFDSITPGYSVQQIGNSLWLNAAAGAGSSSIAVPEPGTTGLVIAAMCGLLFARACRRSELVAAGVLIATLTWTASANAVNLKVVADAELRENGLVDGLGDATDGGSGTGTSLNARWNFSSTPPNKNEWIALKFDLSAYTDKTQLENLALRTTMFRASTNNTKALRLYALTPGTAGEDWDEATITYGTMPGFTFDAYSTTNLLDVGGALQSFGPYSVSGVESEGNVALINPTSLTSLVQGMGTNSLLTLLISFDSSSNGQWRIASREATQTDTGVLTGAAGSFAAYLQFDVVVPVVQGDYNSNGVVDAADYTVWRDNLDGTTLANEEVSPNTVDVADYLYWRERFGATTPGGAGALAAAAVPEPASAVLWVLAGAVVQVIRRRGR